MKVLKLLTKYMEYGSGLAAIIIMMMTVASIISRTFLGVPISGVLELSSHLLLIVVVLGLGGAVVERRHIKVDLVMDHLPKKAQFVIDNIILFLSFVIFGIITWGAGRRALLPPVYTSALEIPDTPFRWALCISLGLCCVSSLALIIENFRNRGKDGY
jgi:TRAP-type C4-dicarboxylate transport system permease small subunit